MPSPFVIRGQQKTEKGELPYVVNGKIHIMDM